MAKKSLPLQLKKKKKKRFGSGAECREKATQLKVSPYKSKNTTEALHIGLTVTESHPSHDEPSQWLTIEGIILNDKSCDDLMKDSGWLSDAHIDAAQRLLLKETGIGGLNDIVLMTHFKKSKVNVAKKDSPVVQCHNIGGHWVVSSSKHGTVIVYESLSTGLNNVLAAQLRHLYHVYCNNGSLTVTVILQQLQRGFSHCGLYCIANATALAKGTDPTTVTWDHEHTLLNASKIIKWQCFPIKSVVRLNN